jgi:hypothetical protein
MVFSKDIFGAIYMEYIKGFVPIRYRGYCLCISPHLILIYLQARVFRHLGHQVEVYDVELHEAHEALISIPQINTPPGNLHMH